MTPYSWNCLVYFLNRHEKEIKEPVADYGGAGDGVQKLLLKGGIKDYVCLDYNTNVDLMKPIKGRKYGTGICMDLLEHVVNPFTVAENITNSLKPGALLFVTAPFAWGYHLVPKDYFRFTDEGIRALFAKMECLVCEMASESYNDLILKRTPENEGMIFPTRVVAEFRKR